MKITYVTANWRKGAKGVPSPCCLFHDVLCIVRGMDIIMNNMKLKKSKAFSLIAILIFCLALDTVNTYFDIYSYIDAKFEVIKEKEMQLVYKKNTFYGDTYSQGYNRFNSSNVAYISPLNASDVGLYYGKGNSQDFSTSIYSYSNPDQNDFVIKSKSQSILSELKGQVEVDSYRHKKLGFYYIFDGDSAINAIEELKYEISNISFAQKVPKALISAVLFREMMFLGQEDLLDGVPFIGGESIGICQIGVKNVRMNEEIVHGPISVIATKSDKEIREMLEDPERAVYFCAVQLRARAIKIMKDPNVDLNQLSKKDLKLVLEGYNQSKISFNIGPVKTKQKYAEETYKYYQDFTKYYKLMDNN